MLNVKTALPKALIQILVCFLIAMREVDTQSYENATFLKSLLLSTYDADVIPVNNQSEVLNVAVTLMLYSQPKIDTIRGSISTAFVLYSYWTDERISWTPAQHNGIETLNIKSSSVWSPAISIAQSMTFKPVSGSWIRIKYNYTGLADYTPGDVYETSCKFNMKYWPFDKHACYLTFYMLDYTLDKMKITVSGIPVMTQYYIQNGEWFLNTDSIQYRIGRANPPSLTYRLLYERHPTFYLITIVIPMTGIAALNCLIFVLPKDERTDFSVTIMLSLSVFLTVVTDELPKYANPVPIMCVYILYTVMFSMILAVTVILNNLLYQRENNTNISLPYKVIVKISRFGRSKIQNKEDDTKSSQSKEAQIHLQEMEEEKNNDTSDIATDETDNLTWQEVSNAIDRVMFFMSILLITIPSVVVVIIVELVSDFEKDSIYWTF